MKIIGIDTSCDDTAIAVLATEAPKSKKQSPNIKLLSNVVSSQVKLHAKYGGVYPSLAKREHQKNLAPVLKKALEEAGLLKISNSKFLISNQIPNSKSQTIQKILERDDILRTKTIQFLNKYQKPKVDAIAVTVGPGLEPCLWAGVNFARALAMWWDLPIMPVNHLEAHLLANFIDGKKQKRSDLSYFEKNIIKVRRGKTFPAVGLVASGGHTELVLIKKIGQYQILGQTRDDAAGECLDKTARILGLGYPGGPAIARLAEQNEKLCHNSCDRTNCDMPKIKKLEISLPRPMINSKDYDFSFSGLKTAVLYDYKKRAKIIRESREYKIAMAKEIQQAVIDVLLKKTLKAINDYQAKTIILGGGVTANNELRHQLKTKSAKLKVNFLAPSPGLSLDNGAMVAMAAWLHFPKKKEWSRIKPNANLSL